MNNDIPSPFWCMKEPMPSAEEEMGQCFLGALVVVIDTLRQLERHCERILEDDASCDMSAWPLS